MTQSLPPKSLILYADDDPDDRQLLTEVFADYGSILELLTFPDGDRLLAYVEGLRPLQPQPGLIILDLNMPVLDGIATLRHLRNLAHYDEVPIVLFTTSTQPHDALRARQYGAGFVTKPLTFAQVHQIVDQMLEHCPKELQEKVARLRGK
ncbi:response regulator [Flaviaesturariibacter aridisoli]|uniref:Response regulator n=1 Tax=Flaviaesturariibacter aridisoli TaxID=2545761 RepID=A0A4R4E0L9_9BACT|nr:response regulator [Flaviaesturariibacter aridisoli]TCZ71377.1 response regulator [Flaviaesturariibacter aridisoli]